MSISHQIITFITQLRRLGDPLSKNLINKLRIIFWICPNFRFGFLDIDWNIEIRYFDTRNFLFFVCLFLGSSLAVRSFRKILTVSLASRVALQGKWPPQELLTRLVNTIWNQNFWARAPNKKDVSLAKPKLIQNYWFSFGSVMPLLKLLSPAREMSLVTKAEFCQRCAASSSDELQNSKKLRSNANNPPINGPWSSSHLKKIWKYEIQNKRILTRFESYESY